LKGKKQKAAAKMRWNNLTGPGVLLCMFDQKHAHPHARNRFAVIPTPDKLSADPNFTGQGITIAFLDSGFYPHPDFAGRVIKFHDISGEERSLKTSAPKGYHWHGTQTVVSCAGDGSLSDGVYRGLASDAKLVLVKVSKNGQISDESIEKGLKWILNNRERYNIRLINMSLGGDLDTPSHESKINQLAEELVRLGVVITVAAGNTDQSHSIPPASAPSVITVGGYSDANNLDAGHHELYHSNFGQTADGLIKPEILAPAMFVAAPILPRTEDYEMAEILSMLVEAPDYSFRRLLEEYWTKAGLSADVLSAETDAARQLIESALHRLRVVATHYQHVDGTSFAAPIAASVVLQMLEANPKLTPAIIKNILISTASRLSGFSAIRQGFGILNAKSAVQAAIKEMHFFDHETMIRPRLSGDKIIFSYHDDNAEAIHLAGDFNHWSSTDNEFVKNDDGLWQTEISNLSSGKYHYKFVIDGVRWVEDAGNGMKEEDGFSGFNSILIVE
jgi:serine protease AprX